MKTKDELITLITSLALQARNNPQELENNTLPLYLEAMAAWIEDMDGYYKNSGKEVPDNLNWSIFADILSAAAVYE